MPNYDKLQNVAYIWQKQLAFFNIWSTAEKYLKQDWNHSKVASDVISVLMIIEIKKLKPKKKNVI